jgi:hypothetical protein
MALSNLDLPPLNLLSSHIFVGTAVFMVAESLVHVAKGGVLPLAAFKPVGREFIFRRNRMSVLEVDIGIFQVNVDRAGIGQIRITVRNVRQMLA